MSRKTFFEVLLAVFVVTLAVSNMLLASQLVVAREQMAFRTAQVAAQAHDLAEASLPTPDVTSLLAEVWAFPQAMATSNKVRIASLAPSVGAGPVDTMVTIKGTGFTLKNNTVIFGYHQITGLKSNGNTIQFTVPRYLIYPCTTGEPCPTHGTRVVVPGSYPVYVSNSRGTSKPATFIVTEGPSPSISP